MEKEIAGFPNYTIREDGTIRRVKDGKAISQHTTSWGYKRVSLWANGKSKLLFVHRLVASAFVPNPNNYPQINHKDENKLNNNADNLEWCTPFYNVHYGKNSPIKQMREARRLPVVQFDKNGNFVAKYESASAAERETGVRQSNISKCCLHRPWFKSAGGYLWEFENSIK